MVVGSGICEPYVIPSIYRGLTENDSRYYGLSLFRTQNDVPKVSAVTSVTVVGTHTKGCITVYQVNTL